VTGTIAAVESVKEREMMIQAGLLSFDLTKAADARAASDRVEQDSLCFRKARIEDPSAMALSTEWGAPKVVALQTWEHRH